MEYIPDLVRLQQAEILDPLAVCNCLTDGLRCLYKMIFVDGLVHADLHPGNLMYSSRALVLLDFGIVAELDAATKKDFVDFFYGIVTNDGISCAEIVLRQAHSVPQSFDRSEFKSAIVDVVDNYSGRTAATFEIASFVTELFRIQREFGVIGSSQFVAVIVALLNFEGLAKGVSPAMDFQSEARRFLPRVRAQSFPRRPWPSAWYSNLNVM
jgi:ubiquinone biosynthesis protein